MGGFEDPVLGCRLGVIGGDYGAMEVDVDGSGGYVKQDLVGIAPLESPTLDQKTPSESHFGC